MWKSLEPSTGLFRRRAAGNALPTAPERQFSGLSLECPLPSTWLVIGKKIVS
jgi:hypothetical protein